MRPQTQIGDLQLIINFFLKLCNNGLMNILLKFFLICFLIVNLIGCTSQNEKVLVEGASGEISSSLEFLNK